MKVQALKTWIFILLITGKLSIIFFLYIKTAVGGLLKSEAMTAGTIILPLFVAYLTVVLEDFFRNPYRQNKKQQNKEILKVKNNIVLATFIILPLYVFGFLFVINFSCKGAIPTDDLPKYLAFVESLLGVYVGIIIKSLFNSKQESAKDK